jgi:hypothetical protein
MILPGHVAATSLTAAAFRADLDGALAASMFPDLIDKPVRWLLRLTPNDRIPAHSALGWLASTLAVYLLRGRRAAYGWLVGYGTHLACDEVNAHLNPGRIYFLWPFKHYVMHTGPTGLQSSLNDFRPASLGVEVAVTAAALWLWFPRAKSRPHPSRGRAGEPSPTGESGVPPPRRGQGEGSGEGSVRR